MDSEPILLGPAPPSRALPCQDLGLRKLGLERSCRLGPSSLWLTSTVGLSRDLEAGRRPGRRRCSPGCHGPVPWKQLAPRLITW